MWDRKIERSAETSSSMRSNGLGVAAIAEERTVGKVSFTGAETLFVCAILASLPTFIHGATNQNNTFHLVGALLESAAS